MHWSEATDGLLATFVGKEKIGVFCDVDGTLSPIVDDPEAAIVLPQSKHALETMQPHLTLLAFVSGRAADDIFKRVGIAGGVYVGNHGMEYHQGDTIRVDTRVTRYRPNLEAVMTDLAPKLIDGMSIEDKGATASVHYRKTANPAQTAEQMRPVLEDIAKQHDIRVHSGKMIFELRPPVEVNKGTAFATLVERYGLDAAIYLGDDVTDADAMRVAGELREAGTCFGLGLGVQHDGHTPDVVARYADLTASSVEDVSSFLDWLSNALSAS